MVNEGLGLLLDLSLHADDVHAIGDGFQQVFEIECSILISRHCWSEERGEGGGGGGNGQ